MKLLDREQLPVLKFCFIQMAFWGIWASFYNYAAMFFTSQGISATYIGIAVSATFLTGIIGRIFWGFICDRKRTIRKTLFVIVLGMWVTIMLFTFSLPPVMIVVLMGVLGFFQMPAPAIIDSWVIKKRDEKEPLGVKINYGTIRMSPSISTAILSFLVGFGIERFGFVTMFILVSVTSLILLFFIFSTGDAEQTSNAAGATSIGESAIRSALLNRSFILFSLGLFCIGFSLQGFQSFLALIMKNVGGTPTHQGLALFFAIIGEFPLILFSGIIIKRIGTKGCFLLSICMYLMQYTLVLLAGSPYMVIAGVVFQGLGYGMFLPSFRIYSYSIAPPEYRTTTLSVTDAIHGGLAGVAGTLIGGLVIDSLGVSAMLIMYLCFGVVSLLLFSLLKIKRA